MILAVDTETTGTDFFHGCRAFLITACDGETNYWFEGDVNAYTREVYWSDEVLEEVQQLLDEADTLVFHNTQFDMRALETIGIQISHLWEKVEDTLLASHALCSGDVHDLKDLSIKYLKYFDDDETEVEAAVKARRISCPKEWAIAKQGHPHFPALKVSSWWKQDMWLCPDECIKYGLCDVERTWLLWQAFRTGMLAEQVFKPYLTRKKLLKICYDMTSYGMQLNIKEALDYLNHLKQEMEVRRKILEKELGFSQRFGWAKREHLLILLYRHLGLPVLKYTKKGEPSTDKDALSELEQAYKHPLLTVLMEGRSLDTERRYVQSYINWADDEGKIHSNTNVTGTRETRQSSTSPNQQNITGKLKELFQPPPGKVWVEYDFVNIELRIWAYATENKELIQAFESGVSVHAVIMEALYPNEFRNYQKVVDGSYKGSDSTYLKNLYRDVKAGNFALIYGASERKIDATYGYQGATQKVFRRFPGIREFTESKIRECEENLRDIGRHAVYTLGKYLLDVPPDEAFKACNYFVQGSAGFMMTLSMIAVVEDEMFKKYKCKLITQVHDSLKIEIPVIDHTTDLIIYSIAETMESASIDIFGVTPVSYKIQRNPKDEESEIPF